ncbi:hypothetical protein Rsub_10113 [Raphidocelis subcapitata]|uniref:Uncharacterized protein n=1 Tax=Raphidocelis subcapitata TaxID=307507 RepID=A0A2V0PDR1_9CHLO|nr:hypothetical protein Rsub_10113 [Raphidocelis subcapitata]|eukprot:GBF97102.1 hypothetical protein Rsub_10113 [Raphidocelis subcapitata]
MPRPPRPARAAPLLALALALALAALPLGASFVIDTPAQLIAAIKNKAEVKASDINPCVAYSIQMATPDNGTLPSFSGAWDDNSVTDVWYSRAYTIERVLRWLKTRPLSTPDEIDEVMTDIISLQGFCLKAGVIPAAPGTHIYFYSFDWCELEKVPGIGPAIIPTPATALEQFFPAYSSFFSEEAVRTMIGSYFDFMGTRTLHGCKVDCLQLLTFGADPADAGPPNCGCDKTFWDRYDAIVNKFQPDLSDAGELAPNKCFELAMVAVKPTTADDLRILLDKCLGFMPYNAGNGLGWAGVKTLSKFAIKDLGGKAPKPFNKGVFTFPEFLSRPITFEKLSNTTALKFAYVKSEFALSR